MRRQAFAFGSMFWLGTLLAACQGTPAQAPTRVAAGGTVVTGGSDAIAHAAAEKPIQAPWTDAGSRLMIEASGTGTLNGTVAFQTVTNSYFQDSAASYSLLSMPAAHALITLGTLDEELYGTGGQAFSTATDSGGKFRLTGVPSDRPYVVSANLAQDHQLSAIVPQGSASATLDEASSMITEMARWQLPARPTPDRKSFADITGDLLASLYQKTLPLLKADQFSAVGAIPSIQVLKAGNGIALRNAYVKAFGAAIAKDGTGGADGLSDAWTGLLGYRPLAVANALPDSITLKDPRDVVADEQGNIYVYDSGALYLWPQVSQGPKWLCSTAMNPGQLYIIGGWYPDFETRYTPSESTAPTAPDTAPRISSGFPIPPIANMRLEPTATPGADNFFFTTHDNNRLMLIPGVDFSRFGRSFKAGRLYTIAGTGSMLKWGPLVQGDDPNTPLDETTYQFELGDGGPAYQAPLALPQGFDMDSKGNLYILQQGYAKVSYLNKKDPDATYYSPFTDPGAESGLIVNVYFDAIRFVRASDGKIFSLRMTYKGQPFIWNAPQAIRVREDAGSNYLYVTDSLDHWVFRVPLPADLDAWNTSVPAHVEIQPVLGQFGKPGFVDLSQPGAHLPQPDEIAQGIPRQDLLLDTPLGLDFDASGNLIVGDAGHLYLLKKADLDAGGGRVYVLAGAFGTNFEDGDARLVAMKFTNFNFDPFDGNLLGTDFDRHMLLRLWTARGDL
ncbi:MAG TPA: hypothetical protein V6D47_01230 [Oscillatoriaceae cyanobacterium]